jgi:NADH-quinone oxidoreductase subunit N
MNSWLSLFTLDFIVIGAALAVLLLDAFLRLPGRALGAVALTALVGALALSFVLPLEGATPHGAYVSGAWVLFFKRIFLVAGVLGVLGAVDWLDERVPRRQAEYYALLLFSLSGMMIVPGARDWLLLVVAFELMGIPLYVLAAYAKTDGPVAEPKLAAEAGLKLFATGAASSAFTLFGLGLVTGFSGSTAIAAMQAGAPTPLVAAGMMMVLGGMGFKVGAVPFHFWVPDTYQGAPAPFVAFLSVAPKAGGLAALSVALLSGWSQQSGVWASGLIAVAAASMVVGNLLALPQSDVRRLLGFSGVAQLGYALLALCARTEEGVAMALFFMATYLFANLGAFLVVYAASKGQGGFELKQLAGLSRRAPGLGAALLVFLLSLAGIPFVVGFWAKLFVFVAAWRAGQHALVGLGVATAIAGLFYYLSVARSTFMAEGSSDAPLRVSPALSAAIGICLVAVVGLGLYPRPLVEQASRAANAFTQLEKNDNGLRGR